MTKIDFLLSNEGVEAIRQMGDRKLRGLAWLERHNGKEYLRFEPYRQRNNKDTHIVINIVVVDASNLSVEPFNPKKDGNI